VRPQHIPVRGPCLGFMFAPICRAAAFADRDPHADVDDVDAIDSGIAARSAVRDRPAVVGHSGLASRISVAAHSTIQTCVMSSSIRCQSPASPSPWRGLIQTPAGGPAQQSAFAGSRFRISRAHFPS
jgi:hypothetical protein